MTNVAVLLGRELRIYRGYRRQNRNCLSAESQLDCRQKSSGIIAILLWTIASSHENSRPIRRMILYRYNMSV
jgi:hypothetical protein